MLQTPVLGGAGALLHLDYQLLQSGTGHVKAHISPSSEVQIGQKEAGASLLWAETGEEEAERDLINTYKYLQGGGEEDGVRLFRAAQWQDEEQWL